VGLWIARSDWNWGTLDRLDLFTGAPQRRYEIAPGTEGIAFGNAGTLAIRVWVMAAFCAAALPVTRTLRQPSRVT
jgi:hypothetical protein